MNDDDRGALRGGAVLFGLLVLVFLSVSVWSAPWDFATRAALQAAVLAAAAGVCWQASR